MESDIATNEDVDNPNAANPNDESMGGSYDVMASFAKDDDIEMGDPVNATSSGINEEIRAYMDLPMESPSINILLWWAEKAPQFPILSRAARFILSIPASSAAPERNFSTAGYLVSDRRSSLSPSLVEDILVCHGNDEIFKKVAECNED